MHNHDCLIALNAIPGLGPKTIARIQQKWPRLEDVFHQSAPLLQEQGLPKAISEAIAAQQRSRLEQELRDSETLGCHILSWESPEYPALLKEIPAAPPVLYCKGDLAALKGSMLAMVGSRHPSIHGERTAFEFAKALAQKSCTIVSGLALGIDTQAHSGCLAGDGRTIAVLGSGLAELYPRRNAVLASKISQKGLLISEFPLHTRPNAGHFPRRNRIISGLSLSTLVVEAAIKSGSLITARTALEQNREVLAIPGSIHSPSHKGCHYLLQQGAKLIQCVEDILEEMTIENANPIPQASNTVHSLASDAQKLVQFMGFEWCSIDQLCERSQLTMDRISMILLDLEVSGIVTSVNGGYIRVTE